MSRSPARLKVTSLPPSRMRPEVGSSRPAIMRRVVVLPQPDGPSRTKNSPFSTTKLESLTAAKSPKLFCRFSTRISAIAYSGNLLTTVNMRVPTSTTVNDQP